MIKVHHTNDCHVLRIEIERLTRDGYKKGYVKGCSEQDQRRDRHESRSPPSKAPKVTKGNEQEGTSEMIDEPPRHTFDNRQNCRLLPCTYPP